MSLLDSVMDAVGHVNSYFWGIAFVFLIGLGLVFTVRLKGLQITKIKETSSLSFSGVKEGSKTKHISSFEAFCIGMGARIGVGNIAGVATAIAAQVGTGNIVGVANAIAIGGYGAVFWMWIFAIVGSASSFMESTLAQIYKEKKSDGHYFGGPAYYATEGLKNRKLGILAAVLLILTFGIGFVAVQACNASNALCGAFEFENNYYIFAAIIAVIAALIIFRGLKTIAKFSAKIVPIMALAWIIFAIIAICMNIEGVPNAIGMIISNAFSPESLIAGGIGTVIVNGLKRGVFSNEAGLGSIANIAATANVKHPVKQGLIQSFGVLVDTLVVCTFTALVILSYGDYGSILDFGHKGSLLVQDVISSTAFGDAANYIIALFMFVFG